MKVACAETNDADPGALLRLWKNARLEYDAASHLLLADGRGLGPSIALHLMRGWHALATIHARRSRLPDPKFESFEIHRDSELLAPVATKKLSFWEDSFTTIRQAALAEPWSEEPHEVDQRSLRFQLRLLGRCIADRRGDLIVRSGWSWKRLFRLRQLLTVAAAVVLILIAVGLARYLDRREDEALSPGPDKLLQPETVKVDLDRLRDFKPRGYSWDGSGNVTFGNRLIVRLIDTWNTDVISVSLDGNDRYVLRLIGNDEEVGRLEVGPSASHGLEVYTVSVPKEASLRGFDSIVVEVLEGDGSHSIGHLLLNQLDEHATP